MTSNLSTPKRRMTSKQSKDCFQTPSKLRSVTFERFASEKLFSVSAILSSVHAASSSESKYIFTFLRGGKRQQAVLEKTFLTGLKKDNIRITWEQAETQLKSGGEVRIDVTRLKSASLSEDWLIFGLYFFSIHNNVLNHFSYLKEIDNDESRQETVDKFGKEDGQFRVSGDSTNSEQDVKAIAEVDSSIVVEGKHGENTSEKILDGQLSAIVFPLIDDTSTDFPVDTNHAHSLNKVENSGKEMINEDIYIDSLMWRSNIDMDDHSIDATFEDALTDNGIFEPLDDLVDAFDKLYDVYFNKDNFEEIGDLNEGQSETLNTSSTWKSSDSWNDSGDLDKHAIYPDTPTLKSTPSSNKNWENSKPTSGTGLVDSGFLDSFDSGALIDSHGLEILLKFLDQGQSLFVT